MLTAVLTAVLAAVLAAVLTAMCFVVGGVIVVCVPGRTSLLHGCSFGKWSQRYQWDPRLV